MPHHDKVEEADVVLLLGTKRTWPVSAMSSKRVAALPLTWVAFTREAHPTHNLPTLETVRVISLAASWPTHKAVS